MSEDYVLDAWIEAHHRLQCDANRIIIRLEHQIAALQNDLWWLEEEKRLALTEF